MTFPRKIDFNSARIKKMIDFYDEALQWLKKHNEFDYIQLITESNEKYDN
jgi:hypothetical protein